MTEGTAEKLSDAKSVFEVEDQGAELTFIITIKGRVFGPSRVVIVSTAEGKTVTDPEEFETCIEALQSVGEFTYNAIGALLGTTTFEEPEGEDGEAGNS